jgi:hypothetical protein
VALTTQGKLVFVLMRILRLRRVTHVKLAMRDRRS